MSRKKRLNKVLKRSSKAIDKYRNPVNKVGRFAVESTEIASKVATDGLRQTRDEIDRIADVTIDRMDEVRAEKKFKDALREQFKRNPKDVRKAFDFGRANLDLVADGVVDIMDEASESYDLYEAERDERKATRKSRKLAKAQAATPAKKRAPAKKSAA